jgi:16S rRNA (cytosine967-C5)-methyltransferase
MTAASLPLSRLLGHTAEALQAVRAGRSLNDALAACPPEARPGTQALVFQVLRRLGSAQAARQRLAPKAPPPAVDALLTSALALLWPDPEAAGTRYAPFTLVNETVEAVKRRVKPSAAFVNAVLRRFLREQAEVVAACARDEVAAFNHPRWWIDRLRADWPAQWVEVLEADNHRAPMTLRVNARHVDVDTYLSRLRDAGLSGERAGPQGIVLGAPVPVTQLPGFADGDVSVQDAAAQLAAPLLIGEGLDDALKRGARVLDACAAPGGKTAHLLELADLDVTAIDSDPERLKRVDDTLARLRLRATTRVGDARTPAAWWDGEPFDAILLDAPCSASGIVRRHPDIRWLRRASDIAALARTQAELLDALWPLLRPGGRLLYATCSVFRAEGQDTVDAFLQREASARPAPRPASPGHLLPLADNASPGSAASPGAPADGFYYALLAKATS